MGHGPHSLSRYFVNGAGGLHLQIGPETNVAHGSREHGLVRKGRHSLFIR